MYSVDAKKGIWQDQVPDFFKTQITLFYDNLIYHNFTKIIEMMPTLNMDKNI